MRGNWLILGWGVVVGVWMVVVQKLVTCCLMHVSWCMVSGGMMVVCSVLGR